MSKNTMRIIASITAGLLLAGAMAACGKVENPEKLPSDTLPEQSDVSNVSDVDIPSISESASSDIPDAAEEPDSGFETAPDITEPEPEPTVSDEDVTEAVPTVSEEPSEEKTSYAEKIVGTAASLLGVPFKSGGDSPEEGFDSSGLTYYCVTEAGAEFSRSIKDQLDDGEKIPYSELKAGDIVYFSTQPDGEAGFCGVYVGGGLIIYSPVPDDFVKTANITTNYWTSRFVTGLRVNGAE